jgi:hypothetical protein
VKNLSFIPTVGSVLLSESNTTTSSLGSAPLIAVPAHG